MANKEIAKDVNMVRPPEGFQQQGSSSGAPWAKLEPGTIISGTLLGRYERDDKKSKSGKSNFFQVRVDKAMKATQGRGADAKLIPVDAGTVVNLNYTKKTAEAYDPFIPSIVAGGEVAIWVHAKSKITTQTGNSFWDMDCFAKVVKSAPGTAPHGDESGPSFDDGEE